MRRKRRNQTAFSIDRRCLFGALLSVAFVLVTVNCTLAPGVLTAGGNGSSAAGEEMAGAEEINLEKPQSGPQNEEEGEVLDETLWADVTIIDDDEPRPTNDVPEYMSLDVRDANLLDVLSLIAHKLDGNIIFLEEPTEITIKTSELSPITTLQTVLQKEGLDYLTIGRNYIVGDRDRLYEDFANRMYLSRFNLFYVSAQEMENFIEEFNVPVESITIDANQQSLWMQGSPMALGKAREVINSLDVMENAAFGEGGSRQIRMPVAVASGSMAEEEMQSLINLLSILLDGFRDERTDLGWGTWDHPGPVPRIHMDWDSPVIRPYDIKMKVTPDIDPAPDRYLHYLIAEGTPDNINIVNEMIDLIRDEGLLFRFPSDEVDEIDEEDLLDTNINDEVNNTGNTTQNGEGGQSERTSAPAEAFNVSLSAVPSEGGSLSGRGAHISGTRVTVEAFPNDGYRFVRWIENGAEVSTSSTYTFTISGSRKLEAVFSKVEKGEKPDEEIDSDQPVEPDPEEAENGSGDN